MASPTGKYAQVRTTHRPVIIGTKQMISTGHYLATQAGMRILQKGGNAIDAGVTAGICLGILQNVVNFAGVAPIIIYHADTKKIVNICGLGVWPKGASVDYFMKHFDGVIPKDVQRSIIPAAPDSWIKALNRYGTMTFQEITEDPIYLAEYGFPVDRFFSNNIKMEEESYNRWPSSREIFLPGGKPPEPGQIFKQRDLAQTLKKMVRAEQKNRFRGRYEALQAARNEFYQGEIASAIVDYHKKHNGLITYEDLANFQVKMEEPVKVTFDSYEIFGCGPWSQGPVLLQALNILKNFNLKSLHHNSPEYIHILSEALKLAFSDREKFYGDPDFVKVPMRALLDEEYSQRRSKEIDLKKAWIEMPPPGDPWGFGREKGASFEGLVAGGEVLEEDTSYLCVVDEFGNAFSATPSDGSMNTPIIPTTGLAISQRGSQSWVDHNHPSSVEAGKRPRLTPNPALVLKNGKLFMPFGTPGGDVQCQAMLQAFLNLVIFGYDLQESIEAPRFATFNFPSSFSPHTYEPGVLRVEARIDEETIQGLKEKGHVIEEWPEWAWKAGQVCAIVVDPSKNVLKGGADPRREAYAIGW